MAAVLDALASYVNHMLAEMAIEEVAMLLGVSGEVDNLAAKLQALKDFLGDAERRRITDQHVQGWVAELKDAMYHATDILELCQLKAMGRKQQQLGAAKNPLLFCLRNPLYAHEVGKRIKALNQRLEGIKQRAGQFNFIRLEAYDDRSRITRAYPSFARRTTEPGFDRSGVVGKKIEQDTKALVEILTSEDESPGSISSNIMVVAIIGVGGIGKTTLAQSTFNNTVVQENFDKTIWLSVNQNFRKAELLRTAIAAAGGEHRGHLEPSLLQPILSAALTGKTILLVMDDMWSVSAWKDVLRTPLTSAVARGSRVLITTRDERVAREMKAIKPYHRVDKLLPEDAWSLLKNQVRMRSFPCIFCPNFCSVVPAIRTINVFFFLLSELLFGNIEYCDFYKNRYDC